MRHRSMLKGLTWLWIRLSSASDRAPLGEGAMRTATGQDEMDGCGLCALRLKKSKFAIRTGLVILDLFGPVVGDGLNLNLLK